MSDVLNKASLVLIPSGYKEDKIYSVIPTSGDGDLTFTRASDATRVNSAGLVERVPYNLLTNSEDFSNANWVTVDLSVTTNQTTAPNGTNTADKLTIGTGTTEHVLYNSLYTSILGQYTTSVYLKKGNSDYALVGDNGSNASNYAYIVINLTNGAVTQSGNSGSYTLNSYDVTSVSNGWYRCTLTYTVTSDDIRGLRVRFSNSATPTIGAYGSITYTGNGTDFMYIWGAQLNEGTLKPYFPTTDRLNVPRLDYSGGSCPSLLLEPQRTNLVTYSEQFDNGAYIKAANNSTLVVTANHGVSPDGTQNADRIQMTQTAGSSNYSQIYQQVNVTSGNTYTWSVWLKSLSGTPTVGWAYDGANWNVITLTTEWKRYTITKTAQTSYINGDVLLYGSLSTSLSADFLMWGYQLEAGSYPTSYIPTTSSAATRVADAAYKTGISSLIGQTEGTLYGEFSGIENAIEFPNLTPTVSDGGNNNRIMVYNDPGGVGAIYVRVVTGGISIINSSILSNPNYQSNNKIAIAYKSNDYAVYFNGTHIYSNTSAGAPPACSQVNLFNDALGNNFAKVEGKQAVLFKTRLTNSELASLTGNQNYTINQAYASYGVASESPNCVQP